MSKLIAENYIIYRYPESSLRDVYLFHLVGEVTAHAGLSVYCVCTVGLVMLPFMALFFQNVRGLLGWILIEEDEIILIKLWKTVWNFFFKLYQDSHLNLPQIIRKRWKILFLFLFFFCECRFFVSTYCVFASKFYFFIFCHQKVERLTMPDIPKLPIKYCLCGVELVLLYFLS